MTTLPKIIGIAGTFASGKDTLAKHLVEKFGYVHVSTGDILRGDAMRLRGSIERPVLFEVANALRHEHGADYFARRALEEGVKISGVSGVVVTGMRSLGEARAVKAAGGVLVFVDAPVEVRYERMTARARDAETQLSLEQFAANEAKEWFGGEGEADFNLGGIKAMSDAVLENMTELEPFLHEAEKGLQLI